MQTFFTPYQDQITELCKKYNVRQLFAFGSVLTDRFDEESDVDLLVGFEKKEVKDPFLHFFDFKFSLEDLFGRDRQGRTEVLERWNVSFRSEKTSCSLGVIFGC